MEGTLQELSCKSENCHFDKVIPFRSVHWLQHSFISLQGTTTSWSGCPSLGAASAADTAGTPGAARGTTATTRASTSRRRRRSTGRVRCRVCVGGNIHCDHWLTISCVCTCICIAITLIWKSVLIVGDTYGGLDRLLCLYPMIRHQTSGLLCSAGNLSNCFLIPKSTINKQNN